MALIKLIVTGDMEKLALHKSLSKLFPTDQDGGAVIWETQKIQCATSYRLIEGREPSQPMLALANAMFAEAIFGKKGPPADLVLVIDDVELGNLGQEQVVATHFRTAVESILSAYNMPTQVRYRELLRAKCSFHLLKPMVEAYLFGDGQALQTAGVSTAIPPRLVHLTDVEAFETNDPPWLPTCYEENKKRHASHPWWRHECHPKHYLNHLGKRGQPDYEYEETHHGRDALIALDWAQVPKLASDAPILRALFEDLADWFGIMNPLGVGSLNPCFYPAGAVYRAGLILRNM